MRGRAVGAVALVCSCSAVQCSAASDLAGMVLNGRGGQDVATRTGLPRPLPA